jgi:hypothetical protein
MTKKLLWIELINHVTDEEKHMLKIYKSFALIICLFMTVATSNEDIKFDIKMPSKISIKRDYLIYSVSMLNASKKTICVPEYLLGGRAILYWYELFDEMGNKLIPGSIVEYYNSPAAFINNRVTLLPKKRKNSVDSLHVESFFPKPGRYRMVFHWDGFLDGDTKGELSRFSCEKWIEVTE